jgi:hypothetical protein
MLSKKNTITSWEFWPFWLFYLPVYFYIFLLALRSWNASFFSLANPSMKWGGLFSYSKYDILEKINPSYRPIQALFTKDDKSNEAFNKWKSLGKFFPLIIKPEMGERGKGVSFVQNESEFHAYPDWGKNSLIIQEYVDYPLEIGVFFIRDLQTGIGRITSLMQRDLLHVLGNGIDTVQELMEKDDRKKRYIKTVSRYYPSILNKIIAKDVFTIIEPIGNHNRGTKFMDASKFINEALNITINDLLKEVQGFNYGRLDIKTRSWEDMYKGINYKVLEINGVNSEPAHIYEPDSSILRAYKSIFYHWRQIYNLSQSNAKKGLKSESIIELYKSYKAYLNQ